MQTHIPTVPFGRRSVPLGLIATQIETNAFAATSRTRRELVHGECLRTYRKPDASLCVSDRALTILHALLTFHPETRSRPQKKSSRPRTCSRRAAPTVAVALTDRRKMIETQPNL
jgi:replication initiation protein RepC